MKTVSMNDFDSLYRTFGPMVLRRCRFLLKDEEKALDAMQDVFVRIIERKSRLQSVCASLFYVTATRVCLNKVRSGPAFETIAEVVSDASSSEAEEKIDSGILLECIFSGRDEKDREIATLHYLDGFTLEETAEKMKMSVSGIRKRLSGLRKYAESRR